MTETVQFIVSCLNDAPFHMKLRLIDFDEKQRHELLQILIDVLVSIDSSKILNSNQYNYYFNYDSSNSNIHTNNVNEILSLLSIIRYKELPVKEEGSLNEEGTTVAGEEEQKQNWMNRLYDGDKETIYSILEFCFSNYEKVKKRAYLAPFLTPIQLPLDITMTQRDDTLINHSNQYQSLQEEFKEVHMRYEQGKKNDVKRGGGVSGTAMTKKEIETLQEEKDQLLNQLKVIRDGYSRGNSGKDNSMFSRVLKATTAVRIEEEREMILRDRIQDQKDALNIVEMKLNQSQQQFKSMQSIISPVLDDDVGNSNDRGSPEVIMNEIKKQLAEVTMTVRSDLVSKRSELQQKIQDFERFDHEKSHTEDDLDCIQEEVKELEEECNLKQKTLQKETSKKSYSKIAIFKQHADAAKKKLKVKESVVRMKSKEMNSWKEKVNTEKLKFERNKLNPIEETKGDSGESKIQVKVKEQKRLERHLSHLQYESLILQRTMDILKSRHQNIEKFMSDQEEKANAKGFHNAKKTLEDTVENVTKIDEMKGQTLQEISEMVTKITEKLKVERERLQPMIQKLKSTREEYQEVEDIHQTTKKRYDKMSTRLAVDRQQLERECDLLQEEWQQHERNYHYLTNANEITMVNLEKVRLEESWLNGVDKMLPDFKSLHDLYRNKFSQQENLAKQLRVEQRSLNENESESLKQRQVFASLKIILDLKVKLKKEENWVLKSEMSVSNQIKTIEGLSF